MPQAPAKISVPLVVAGYVTLAVAAYLDNVRGPLLPVISAELGLSFEDNGWFLMTGQLAGIAAALALIGLGGRASHRRVGQVAAVVAIAAGVLGLFVHDFGMLMVMVALLGATITAMGTICNLFVLDGTPAVVRGRALSGLHAMYGVGSLIAGAVASWGMAHEVRWAMLFAGLIPVHLVMLGFVRRRVREPVRADGDPTEGFVMPDRRHVLIIATIVAYVGGEVTTSMWLSTFLVKGRGLAPADAAVQVSGFFLAMLVSRCLCFALVRPRHEKPLLALTLVVGAAAFLVGYFARINAAFALVGLVGPFFPVYLSVISRELTTTWKRVTLWIFLGIQSMLAVLNVAVGRMADLWGIDKAFLAPPVMLALAGVLLAVQLERAKRPGWRD